MNRKTFELGDEVFFPVLSSSIFKLSKASSRGLHLEYADVEYVFDTKGYLVDSPFNKQQSIFHATYTEYERLSNFYPNSNFSEPSKTKEELVNIMIQAGVPYFVLNRYGFGFTELRVFDSETVKEFIGIRKPNTLHIDDCDILDQYTGKKIIDWVKGKPVLSKD